jgi:hypothetical protein
MKLFKRLTLAISLLLVIMTLSIPSFIWWLFTRRDFLSPITDKIFLKYDNTYENR